MPINLHLPDITELKPRITVFGVGGGGCNAVNNMIKAGLQGVEFVVANTDAQALAMSRAERIVQMGVAVTEGLGAGSQPEIGRAAAEETLDEINDHLSGAHMAFITAGMGGGTGTGAAPVVARAAREAGILTVGVVTKPFQFEGHRRMRIADQGINELQKHVDTLIVIPNQNLFRIANEKTTFADAFAMADEVLYSGVACITDLMVKDGLINLDFADVRSVMREMGKAMMGTGEAAGDKRAVQAAEAAISNPLLDDVCMKGARGLLISITGGRDMTLFEVDEAASRVREEVDGDANIIFGATFDEGLEGVIRVSVVATGIEQEVRSDASPAEERMAELARRLKSVGATGTVPAALAHPGSARREAVSEGLTQKALENLESGLIDAMARPGQPAAQGGDVRIAPLRPDPSLVALHEGEPDLDAPVREEAARRSGQPFIPPAAERPEEAQPRMPRVEDFPAVAQRQLRSRAGAPAARSREDEKRPRGLLARITHGLQKRDEDADEDYRAPAERAGRMEIEPRLAPARAAPERERPAQPAPARRASAPPAAHEAARQQPRRMGEAAPAAGTLDPRGRPTLEPHADDALEIPAFLRRQSS